MYQRGGHWYTLAQQVCQPNPIQDRRLEPFSLGDNWCSKPVSCGGGVAKNWTALHSLELIRKMTPFLTHSTPSRSARSLPKVSTDPGEAQNADHQYRLQYVTGLSFGSNPRAVHTVNLGNTRTTLIA